MFGSKEKKSTLQNIYEHVENKIEEVKEYARQFTADSLRKPTNDLERLSSKFERINERLRELEKSKVMPSASSPAASSPDTSSPDAPSSDPSKEINSGGKKSRKKSRKHKKIKSKKSRKHRRKTKSHYRR